MRGPQTLQGGIFSYVSLESRIPEDHPLRAIRRLVDAALEQLSRRFDGIYAKGVGRPSVPPEQLLRALLLQVLYTIRSERQLIEQIDYNLLYRWFVGLVLDVQVRLEDLGVIEEFAGRPLPPLGPLVASARVEGDVSDLRVRNLDAQLGQRGGLWAQLSGGIDDLRQLRGLNFQLAAEADDLGVFEELTGQALPPLTPVVVAARLVGDFPTPRLEKLDVELGRRGQTFAQVSGSIDDLQQLRGMDLELVLEADDLELLEELADQSLPPLGPLVVRAHVSGDASSPHLDRLEAQLGRRSELWTQVTGSIGDLLELRGVALSAEVSAPDIRALGPYLERDLPDLGPLSGTAELVDADGTLGIERFHIRAGRRGALLVEGLRCL